MLTLAAGIGVLVGVILARPSGTTLAVATQQREGQIVIFLMPGTSIPSGDPNWGFVDQGVVAIDIADYPANSTFRLDIVTPESDPDCYRLYDVSGDAAVPGSESCAPFPPTVVFLAGL